MQEDPELEIAIQQREAEGFTVQLRYRDQESDVDRRATARGLNFDFEALRQAAGDPQAYGQRLREGLFADQQVQSCFQKARTAAQTGGQTLRLRLSIGAGMPELHLLQWESLQDPDNGQWLATDENILFSRHLSSFDMRPVRLRASSQLRALIVVANPINVTDYAPGGRPLAAVDVAGEIQRARQGMGDIPATVLPDEGRRATLNNIADALRETACDILYLVCHGAFIDGATRLWLEDDSGAAAVTSGPELMARFRELRQLPRLVVLASCQTAGDGEQARTDDEGVLTALGPRLAEAGVPAVIAMQGNVLMNTVARFMPAFFGELQRDGHIDRAVAVARGNVRDAPDWWMPVLFMRLVSGRLWYDRGFAGGEKTYDRWPALINQIRRQRCTPILGSAMVESLVGPQREIACRWAETYHFPLAARFSSDLPQVAQYMQTVQDWNFPRDELMREVSREISNHWPHLNSETGDSNELPADRLLRLLSAARRELQKNQQTESHQLLAEMPFPIYITTNYGNLLADALQEAGKQPHTELCYWRDGMDEPIDFSPTVDEPLVYHLFGHLNEPDSLVLTEDDYFDYLIGYTRLNSRPRPSPVLPTLTNRALMFLGFRLSDWDFRVFFRSLMGKEGRRLRGRYKHVAVQVDPEEGSITEPARARKYLERYFEDADINIYWGSADDFVEELHDQWKS